MLRGGVDIWWWRKKGIVSIKEGQCKAASQEFYSAVIVVRAEKEISCELYGLGRGWEKVVRCGFGWIGAVP